HQTTPPTRAEQTVRPRIRLRASWTFRFTHLLRDGRPGSEAGSVRGQSWRTAEDEQDVLLRRLRRVPTERRTAELDHGPDTGDAARRLLGVAPEHDHLRPDDDAAHAVCRQYHPGEPDQSDCAPARFALPDADHRGPGQQLFQS